MRGGRLRHRVTIQQRTATLDVAGSPSYTWAAVGTIWAEVRSPAGNERVASEVDQMKATVTHTVRIRAPYFTITPAMRVLWGARVLEIISVTDPDNRGASRLLYCMEVLEP